MPGLGEIVPDIETILPANVFYQGQPQPHSAGFFTFLKSLKYLFAAELYRLAGIFDDQLIAVQGNLDPAMPFIMTNRVAEQIVQ